jgi:hypothetical protein
MSLRTDRLRSGLGHFMSDILVDTGPVEQQAPSTSLPLSYAQPCQWIRRHTGRYKQQGADLKILNHVPPTSSAPPTSKSHRVPPTDPQYCAPSTFLIDYKKTSSKGTARHTAPNRVSGRSRPPPTNRKPKSHLTWSCAAKTRNPPRTHHRHLFLTHHLLFLLN